MYDAPKKVVNSITLLSFMKSNMIFLRYFVQVSISQCIYLLECWITAWLADILHMCCENLPSVSLFVCIVIICSTCCKIDDIFLICGCFFYLHLFSEVAACWALLATVYFAVKKYFFPDMICPQLHI